MVWPLVLKKPGPWDRGMVTGGMGEKPERRRLSYIKTSRYWRRTDASFKIVTFRITANTMAQNGRGWIQLFNVWHRNQERKKKLTMAQNGKGRIQFFNVWRWCQKKSWICPLPFRAIVFAAIRKETILRPASMIHQRGEVLMDNGRRHSGFWPSHWRIGSKTWTPTSVVYQSGEVLINDRCWRSGFWPSPPVTWSKTWTQGFIVHQNFPLMMDHGPWP